MNEPSPIRGRWTLWGAGPGFPTMADVRLPSGAQVEVVPVPDEQAIERAAKALRRLIPFDQDHAELVRAVLAAALEQPE